MRCAGLHALPPASFDIRFGQFQVRYTNHGIAPAFAEPRRDEVQIGIGIRPAAAVGDEKKGSLRVH